MQEIETLQNILDKDHKIVITTHYKPDGDAIGSSLALLGYFKKKGFDAKVVIPNEFPSFLDWLPMINESINFEEKRDDALALIDAADYIFCLDFNGLGRINDLGEFVGNASAKKIMFDHHLFPDDFDDYRLWNNKASSTCEMIYEYIKLDNGLDLINSDIAHNIYVGMVTDTGSFKFNSTSANVHRIAAEMIEKGVEVGKTHNLIYDSYTENRLRFIGYILKDKMTLIPEYNTAFIAISQEDVKTYNLSNGDTEGLVNYPMSLGTVNSTVMISDKTKPGDETPTLRFSFRSKGDISINTIAKEHFNGGGHKNAAGGTLSISLKEGIEAFKSVLPKYKDELLKEI